MKLFILVLVANLDQRTLVWHGVRVVRVVCVVCVVWILVRSQWQSEWQSDDEHADRYIY